VQGSRINALPIPGDSNLRASEAKARKAAKEPQPQVLSSVCLCLCLCLCRCGVCVCVSVPVPVCVVFVQRVWAHMGVCTLPPPRPPWTDLTRTDGMGTDDGRRQRLTEYRASFCRPPSGPSIPTRRTSAAAPGLNPTAYTPLPKPYTLQPKPYTPTPNH